MEKNLKAENVLVKLIKNLEEALTVVDSFGNDIYYYTEVDEYDSTIGSNVTYYYFWVKNKTSIPLGTKRISSVLNIASNITNPTAQGIKWLNATGKDSFIVSNLRDDTQENTNKEESSEDENSEQDNLEKEIETLKEEKIRLLAEMENLRKRFEREKVETIKFGSINLARDILSPGDNLERALDALPEDENHPESIKNLIDGLKMVLKEYKSTLEKHGVKKIETLNQKFDHNFHQAMMEVENNDVEEGTVVQEVQSGYTMHDRLLRAAMVGVSKKPVAKTEEPTEEIEEDNPENESKEKS